MERLKFPDTLKGICILLMIIGHCEIPDTLYRLIYAFHIPAFFLISGYFFREESIKKSLLKNTSRLLLPYVIFTGIVALKLCFDILRGVSPEVLKNFGLSVLLAGPGVESHQILPIGVIWFLPALFFTRILFNVCYKFGAGYGIVILNLIGFTAVCVPFSYLPWGISQGLVGVIFYSCGYLLSLNRVPKKFWLLFGMCAWSIAFFQMPMDLHFMIFPMPFLNVFTAIASSVFLILLLKKMEILTEISKKKSSHFYKKLMKLWLICETFLSNCGRLSLLILGLHFIETSCLYLVNYVSLSPFAFILLRIFFNVVIAFGLSKISFVRKIFNLEINHAV